jgi:hypothetical protein
VRALPRLLAALALLPGPLLAQDSAPPLRAVEIIREDVADSSEEGTLAELANALHWRTRAWVVQREVLLRPGSPYDSALAAETARNLRSLGIFRRVLIDTVHTDSGTVLRVVTKDGWSTQPIFDINTAAGQTAFTLGVQEQNVLGFGGSGSIRYRSTPDRTAWTFSLRQPRLIANRLNVSGAWEERSDGRYVFGSVAQPFFTLSSRWAVSTDLTIFDGDVLVFRGGDLSPEQVLRRHWTLARASVGHAVRASPGGYVRVGLTAQLEQNAFLPSPVSVPFADTTRFAAGPYLSWAHARYAVVHNVRSFLREEDEFVGATLRVGVLAAPQAFGYDEDGVGLQASLGGGHAFSHGFVRASLNANGLYTANGLDSGTVVLQGDAVIQPARAHAVIAGGFVGWQKDPVPALQFDLGLTYGLRAFPLHAFVGDRGYLVSAEYRVTLTDDYRGVVGVALGAFVDHGGAWYVGDPVRRGTDFGVGLRVGPSRLASGSLFRLDVAYRLASAPFGAGWSLVFGRGFTF